MNFDKDFFSMASELQNLFKEEVPKKNSDYTLAHFFTNSLLKKEDYANNEPSTFYVEEGFFDNLIKLVKLSRDTNLKEENSKETNLKEENSKDTNLKEEDPKTNEYGCDPEDLDIPPKSEWSPGKVSIIEFKGSDGELVRLKLDNTKEHPRTSPLPSTKFDQTHIVTQRAPEYKIEFDPTMTKFNSTSKSDIPKYRTKVSFYFETIWRDIYNEAEMTFENAANFSADLGDSTSEFSFDYDLREQNLVEEIKELFATIAHNREKEDNSKYSYKIYVHVQLYDGDDGEILINEYTFYNPQIEESSIYSTTGRGALSVSFDLYDFE